MALSVADARIILEMFDINDPAEKVRLNPRNHIRETLEITESDIDKFVQLGGSVDELFSSPFWKLKKDNDPDKELVGTVDGSALCKYVCDSEPTTTRVRVSDKERAR